VSVLAKNRRQRKITNADKVAGYCMQIGFLSSQNNGEFERWYVIDELVPRKFAVVDSSYIDETEFR
jgi:hypothetical protein